MFKIKRQTKHKTTLGNKKAWEIRAEKKLQQASRKKHGKTKSTLIGRYEFDHKPVTELHQPGVIWQ